MQDKSVPLSDCACSALSFREGRGHCANDCEGSYGFRIPSRLLTGKSDLMQADLADSSIGFSHPFSASQRRLQKTKGAQGGVEGDAIDLSNPWLMRLRWNSQNCLSSIELVFDRTGTESASCQNQSNCIPGPMRDLVEQLIAYFQTGQPLRGLNWEYLDDSAWTPFQRKVYRAIAKIPHGETRTYAWVASRIGQAGASRAVGQALSRNPIPVLIPCHRVVSNKSLGGFMGASASEDPEVDLKRKLLSLEEEYRNPIFPFLVAHSHRTSRKGAVA